MNFHSRLAGVLSEAEIEPRRASYLYNPGISVVRDAHIATQAGRVHAMHDPTEGGLAGAIWELAASQPAQPGDRSRCGARPGYFAQDLHRI